MERDRGVELPHRELEGVPVKQRPTPRESAYDGPLG